MIEYETKIFSVYCIDTSLGKKDSGISTATDATEHQRQIRDKDEQIQNLNNQLREKDEQIQQMIDELKK
jgi:peptidoglycan hydrolase CwlO-like protein